MQAKIAKVNRPKYFTHNGVCVRIDNIVFVQKCNLSYGSNGENSRAIAIGISSSQFQPVEIFCKDEIEQATVFSELTTILTAL